MLLNLHQRGSKVVAYSRINGCRTEFSIKRGINPDKWPSHVGAVKGTSEECRTTNAFLSSVRMKRNEHYRLLIEAGDIITVDMIRNAYLGVSERGKKTCEVFQYHNKRVEQLVGADYSDGTLERYRTALKHIQDFIQWKYNLTDIDVKKVDYQFIAEYECIDWEKWISLNRTKKLEELPTEVWLVCQ